MRHLVLSLNTSRCDWIVKKNPSKTLSFLSPLSSDYTIPFSHKWAFQKRNKQKRKVESIYLLQQNRCWMTASNSVLEQMGKMVRSRVLRSAVKSYKNNLLKGKWSKKRVKKNALIKQLLLCKYSTTAPPQIMPIPC